MYKINECRNNKNEYENEQENEYENECEYNNEHDNLILFRNNESNMRIRSKHNKILEEDINKMQILPPNCPMTPKTFTDYYSDNKYLRGTAPYVIKDVKHPKDGQMHKVIEYRNFYNNVKKDVLKYTKPSTQFLYYDEEKHKPYVHDKNMILYETTRNKKQFAVPMAINGSNKVEDIFNNCLNLKTFEYKRFANKRINDLNWVDNPLFTQDITEETNDLKGMYMDSRIKNRSRFYTSVLEDMVLFDYDSNK